MHLIGFSHASESTDRPAGFRLTSDLFHSDLIQGAISVVGSLRLLIAGFS